MSKIHAHVVISGMVQGVFFRSYMFEKAREMGLTGWVRNIFSGDVEAVFEGEEDPVKEMVRWCHHGPPSASVQNVDVEYDAFTGEFNSFRITY